MKKIYAILKILCVIFFITTAHFICEATPYYLDKTDYGDKVRIVIDDVEETNNLPDEVIIENDEVLLSLETVKKYFDSVIYKTDEAVKINHDKYIVTLPLNSNVVKVNTTENIMNIETKLISGDEEDIVYMPIKALEEVYDIEVDYNNKVIITTKKGDEFSKGTLAKNVKLKKYKREKCLTVSNMKKGDEIEILTPNYEIISPKEYLYVRTSEGELGYVMRKNLKLEKIENRVIVDGVEISRRLPHDAKIVNEKIMLSIESAEKFIDEYIYFDEEFQTVIAISNDKVAKLPVDSKTIKVNDVEKIIEVPVQFVEDELYIPIEELAEIYNLEIEKDEAISINKIKPTNMLAENETKKKISLVWEYAQNFTRDRSNEKKKDAINVVSPTWIYASDEKGNITESIDSTYISWAKSNDYEVWPTIKNDNIGIEKTSLLVTNMENRKEFIDNIVEICKQYSFEGINLDFEHMYQRDRDEYVIFVRELAATLKQEGMITSVDVNVPDGSSEWSLCYKSKAISDSCDYIMVMAYDQYAQSSSTAGPVAGLNWVEKNLKKMIERDEIDNEKLVLGVPFYSRQWNVKDGKVVKTTALSMENAKKQIGNNAEWNEELGQYVVTSKTNSNGVKTITYVEDERALEKKLELMEKYDLAGVAAWRRGFETEEAWNIIEEKIK